jgi:hypothetical protein
VKAEAKALRLRRQKRLLQKKLRALSDQEKLNILNLEINEAAAEAVATTPAELLSSLTRFSQVSFGSFDRTSPVPTGSS